MNKVHPTALSIVLAIVALLASSPATAQWSAEPGATVRNAFGPQAANKANQCRGACGAGCPAACKKTVSYECLESSQFRQVVTYDCGTHQGCRVHDDCLDACLQNSASGGNCAARCDDQVMERFGFESTLFVAGRGRALRRPHQLRIHAGCPRRTGTHLPLPGWREPAMPRQRRLRGGQRHPGGARVRRLCGRGRRAMRVSAFRSGPACGDSVCEQSADIRVTGADSCAGGRCTRFGMEFDYENADPSAPLECTPSTSGGDSDFIGDLAQEGRRCDGHPWRRRPVRRPG